MQSPRRRKRSPGSRQKAAPAPRRNPPAPPTDPIRRLLQLTDDFPRILSASDQGTIQLEDGTTVDLAEEAAVAYTVHVPIGRQVRVLGRRQLLSALTEDDREQRILDWAGQLARSGRQAGWLPA